MNSSAHVPQHSAGGAEVTELILDVFRLNGRLLAAGDRLVADLGLTSARWQVLGALALAGGSEPVAGIARTMGLSRQAVQRVVNELAAERLVGFAPNPRHRRAKLVVLTSPGARAYRSASDRQGPWANDLARGLPLRDLRAARAVVRAVVERLEVTARATSVARPSSSTPGRRRRSHAFDSTRSRARRAVGGARS
jgi:DNA-binding MarR family transcriptional regulator